MPAQSDAAIVLRLSEYSESSQIVSLMTESNGQVRLIAKGARRSTKARPSIGLDLLEYGEVSYVAARGESGLGTLIEWRQLDLFLDLRSRLVSLYAGLYAAELTAATVQEHDTHPELFAALVDLLRSQCQMQAISDTITISAMVRFQASLLKSIGYAPNLRQCVGCGKPRVRGAAAWFSSHAGGMLCADCQGRHAEKHPIDAHLLDGARGSTPPEQWFALLDYHLSHVAGRAFECAAALRSALAKPGKAL